jgi:hypothetical protein
MPAGEDAPYDVSENGKVLRISRPVSSHSDSEIAQRIRFLFDRSESVSYAAFDGEGPSDIGVILLCGFNERFRTIRLLRHVRARTLVVQDVYAPWFTGSATCGGIEEIRETATSLFPEVTRWLLLGQSSGGYGALYLSRLLPTNVALVFSPQTFDDRWVKAKKIIRPPHFKLSSTKPAAAPIRDLRDVFAGASSPNSKSYIVSAFSEHQNPPTSWLWLDAMHWGRLAAHPDVTIVLTGQASHAVLQRNTLYAAGLVHDIAALPAWDHDVLLTLISQYFYGAGLS